MRRRFFRLRRIAVGLAFAALVVPAAASAYTVLDDGPATGVQRTDARHAALLNRQTVAPASPVSPQPTGIGQQAYAARMQAMADAYANKAGGTVVRSENSFGAPGPSAGGATGPSTVQAVSTKSSSGFDWNDAGIGAAVAFGIVLLLVAAIAAGRKWHSRPQGAGLANA